MWGFPKIRGSILGVPITRTNIIGVDIGVPSILGNHHVLSYLGNLGFRASVLQETTTQQFRNPRP